MSLNIEPLSSQLGFKRKIEEGRNEGHNELLLLANRWNSEPYEGNKNSRRQEASRNEAVRAQTDPALILQHVREKPYARVIILISALLLAKIPMIYCELLTQFRHEVENIQEYLVPIFWRLPRPSSIRK